MGEMKVESEPSRSSFVTVLAWISIVFSGFAVFVGVIQNIAINTIFPLQEMQNQAALGQAGAHGGPAMPAPMLFMLQHIQAIVALTLLSFILAFVISVGLLKRKNWGRIGFIAMMALGIAWNLGGLILQQQMFAAMNFPVQGDDDMGADFGKMMTFMKIFSLVLTLGLTALNGWIIKRLCSAEIRQEFDAAPSK
jgi:hypothetical protein